MTTDRKRRRWPSLLVVLALLAYIGLRIGSGAATAVLDAPYQGYSRQGLPAEAGGEPVPGMVVGQSRVEVPRGASAARVAQRLEAAGVVRDARLFQWYLRLSGRSDRIHAGEYLFTEPRSMREVAAILVQGRVALEPVTIREGVTRWQVAAALAEAGFGTEEQALRATEDVGLIADLHAEAATLEGYLFPDTYLAPRTAGPDDLVAMMVSRFRSVWTARRRARAAELGLDLSEAVTLASLVESEAALAEERALVAAVFHNRLDRGMLLQCDPTLLYALFLDGRTDRNIRDPDFEHDSPYNTYRYAGLPPGPIGNPGEASLEAALYPADVDYLYFVGRNDGSHAFARTLREHNANVNRYQRGR